MDNYRAQNKAVRSYTVVSEWTITGHRTRLFAHMIISEKDYSTLNINKAVRSYDYQREGLQDTEQGCSLI